MCSWFNGYSKEGIYYISIKPRDHTFPRPNPFALIKRQSGLNEMRWLGFGSQTSG